MARLICDVHKADGTVLESDPRHVLKRVLQEAKEMGYTFDVGPECEFFLFHLDDDARPTTISHEQAGYFDVSPLDLGENARRDIVLTLEEMGFVVDSDVTVISEVAGNLILQVKDSRIALDKSMANRIMI